MSAMKKRVLMVAFVLLAVGTSCGNDGKESAENTAVDSTVSETTISDIDTTTVDTSTTVAPTTTTDGIVRINVTVGIDSGVDRIEQVSVGDSIELTMLNPDEDDEFHVHGFDLGGDETPAGEEKTFAFTATEPGDFEVESHATGEVLVVIRVS